MTASFLPALLPAWVALCAWVAHKIGELFIDNPLRPELKAIIFLALLPLLLIDELIAESQFSQLCAAKAIVTIHAAEVRGQAVYLTELPPEPIPGGLVPVQMQKRVYVDARTHEPLMTFNILRAQGGKLARALGSQGGRPITFDGECQPRNWQETFAALGLRQLDIAAPGEAALQP